MLLVGVTLEKCGKWQELAGLSGWGRWLLWWQRL